MNRIIGLALISFGLIVSPNMVDAKPKKSSKETTSISFASEGARSIRLRRRTALPSERLTFRRKRKAKGLKNRVVRKVIVKRMARIQHCFQRTNTGKKLSVNVNTKFLILKTGKVKKVRASANVKGKWVKPLEKCVEKQFKALVFPSSKEKTPFNYNIAFSAK